MNLYYQDDSVTLYLGDFRDVLPTLGITADLIVADPPYGETSLEWDTWPDDWPSRVEPYARSMWCFGSMRMFLDRRDDFRDWKLSQDVVWEKHNGSGFAADRFRRVHEYVLHWYRGDWSAVYHETPRVPRTGPDKSMVRRVGPSHTGAIGELNYEDDGQRLIRSVVKATRPNNGLNETEKPAGILEPLIAYGCPAGGLVLDPFAGSASTLLTARNIGRRAVGIEKRESQCEKAALRLANATFDFGQPA